MAVFNQIQKFIEERGISRYRFWKTTGLGRDTAYRLCNDPTYVPTGNVLDKICEAYKVQPGEFLVWTPTTTNGEDGSASRSDLPDTVIPPNQESQVVKVNDKLKSVA
jgi:DNA-binding Xre family transcriptional regulator